MEENKKEVTMQDIMSKLNSLEKQMNDLCGAVGMLVLDNLNKDMEMEEKIAHMKCSKIMGDYLFNNTPDEEKETIKKIRSILDDILKK